MNAYKNTPNKQKANKQKRPPSPKKTIKPHAEMISETIEETIHFRGEKIVPCNTSVTREIHSYQRRDQVYFAVPVQDTSTAFPYCNITT